MGKNSAEMELERLQDATNTTNNPTTDVEVATNDEGDVVFTSTEVKAIYDLFLAVKKVIEANDAAFTSVFEKLKL